MSTAPPSPTDVTGPDGTPVRVYVTPGAADAVPVVLVHGLGSDAFVNWEQAGWLRSLRATGRPLIRLDQRGHGGSGAPHDPAAYRLPLLVGDLAAVVASTVGAGRPVDAIGYSLGSRVLLEYLATPGMPAPVRRLVLGGSAGQPLLQGFDPDLVDRALGGGPVPAHAETARIARTIAALPGNDERALAALVRGLHTDPAAVRRAPDPAVPTLVAVGTDDPLHDPARAWTAGLPAATFVGLPGRTHVSAVPSGVFRSAAVAFLG
ncbi:alpha/beta fold hydrolase [Nakamurella deserti]|uniref:alpha/beta fold hydrolase n=1 Tax=Nakamurella deserti TaxID=2164074 RepID=UPI001300BECE|nr:alpha/beta fold hydrolase [Nakamurella deserti]